MMHVSSTVNISMLSACTELAADLRRRVFSLQC